MESPVKQRELCWSRLWTSYFHQTPQEEARSPEPQWESVSIETEKEAKRSPAAAEVGLELGGAWPQCGDPLCMPGDWALRLTFRMRLSHVGPRRTFPSAFTLEDFQVENKDKPNTGS